ncbi:MAG TPA: hypothetical protein PK069_07475 [Methanolinea sp.]|nr:hypothetical protein [Methanolinea sp.]HQK56168.1 hypothetical protein [Methanolinea sp.]
MAVNHEEAQWMVMLGLIISFTILFLALVINQSILVGQTTAESALEFPKSDIFDLKNQIREIKDSPVADLDEMISDITLISLQKKGALVEIIYDPNWEIHYNNGVTQYTESIIFWDY